MKIRDISKIKGRPVITIGVNDTVHAAIEKLVENNIGALPVYDDKATLLGIVSERDLLKECVQHSKTIHDTKVKDIMTRDIVVAVPEDDLEYIMSIMVQKRIRHLPVMVGPKMDNMISIRDLIEAELEDSEMEIRFLNAYISGGLV